MPALTLLSHDTVAPSGVAGMVEGHAINEKYLKLCTYFQI